MASNPWPLPSFLLVNQVAARWPFRLNPGPLLLWWLPGREAQPSLPPRLQLATWGPMAYISHPRVVEWGREGRGPADGARGAEPAVRIAAGPSGDPWSRRCHGRATPRCSGHMGLTTAADSQGSSASHGTGPRGITASEAAEQTSRCPGGGVTLSGVTSHLHPHTGPSPLRPGKRSSEPRPPAGNTGAPSGEAPPA